MNILMVYHRLPYPPNKGEKMRGWQQVRHLALRHRVWLACFVDAAPDWEHVPVVEQCCAEVCAVPLERRAALARGAFGLLAGSSLTDGFFGSRAMQEAVDTLRGRARFDVAFAFSSGMGAYIEHFPAGRRVLDMNDFDSRKWQIYAERSAWPLSELYRAEARRLAARERQLIARCDLTLLVNDRECARCPDPALAGRLAALPTPMDLQRYAEVRSVPGDPTVGFVGTLDYRPNVEAVTGFVRNVWPRIRDRHPLAEYFIIGRRPPREIQRLGRLPGVTLTGAVQRIEPWLQRLRVFAASARTDIGVQTKVLEALAAGRPTVITAEGHGGIGATPGRDYEVAGSDRAFAEHVSALLEDHARCERLSAAAVEFARRRHDVAVVMPEFERLVVGSPPGAPAAPAALEVTV